jgi:hypothetical protein
LGQEKGGTQQPYRQVPPAQGESLAAGLALQPLAGSQASTVQESPSSQAVAAQVRSRRTTSSMAGPWAVPVQSGAVK